MFRRVDTDGGMVVKAQVIDTRDKGQRRVNVPSADFRGPFLSLPSFPPSFLSADPPFQNDGRKIEVGRPDTDDHYVRGGNDQKAKRVISKTHSSTRTFEFPRRRQGRHLSLVCAVC